MNENTDGGSDEFPRILFICVLQEIIEELHVKVRI